MPLESIRKNNRHLHHFEPLAPQLVGHLDLEAVSVRTDLIQVDRLQRSLAKTFISASRISKRHPCDNLHVLCRRLAQHQTAQWPVDYPNAVQVTRAKHEVGILGGFEEHRDVIRV